MYPRRVSMLAVAIFAALSTLGHAPAQAQTPTPTNYSSYSKATFDTLIAHGYDKYGTLHRANVLASILGVNTLTSPPDGSVLAYDEAWRVTRHGRRSPGGGNLATDQNLLGGMYKLSTRSGNTKYSTFADNYTTTYTSTFTDAGNTWPATNHGFVWWGIHRWVDFHNDANARKFADGNYHELIPSVAPGRRHFHAASVDHV
ncbi:MAG TPA: hypothetical protein VK324_06220 [Tepidisphaeraceae bacterium]|nr:hypothetical protein [Tepidisphaeraceae bacterium]